MYQKMVYRQIIQRKNLYLIRLQLNYIEIINQQLQIERRIFSIAQHIKLAIPRLAIYIKDACTIFRIREYLTPEISPSLGQNFQSLLFTLRKEKCCQEKKLLHVKYHIIVTIDNVNLFIFCKSHMKNYFVFSKNFKQRSNLISNFSDFNFKEQRRIHILCLSQKWQLFRILI
ncbi:unnamed protein product [Paramecium octaurelia]|uniref:Uncharacterized protein n=1 Tax=Paramecium octaurelia TaxID=43137 RepID=A0A8S1XYN7_PAROT|nr:unnamed protein product [Paramecium octaurelia]